MVKCVQLQSWFGDSESSDWHLGKRERETREIKREGWAVTSHRVCGLLREIR